MRDAIQSLQDALAKRQHNRILRLSFPKEDGPGAVLLVNSIDAVEGLSRPFEYTLELLSDDAHIHLKDLQGKMLCVELVRKDGTLRYFNGLVFRFGLKKVDGRIAYYGWGHGSTTSACARITTCSTTPACTPRPPASPATMARWPTGTDACAVKTSR